MLVRDFNQGCLSIPRRLRNGMVNGALAGLTGLVACLCFYLAAQSVVVSQRATTSSVPESARKEVPSGQKIRSERSEAVQSDDDRFAVVVRTPGGPPLVHTGLLDSEGLEVTVSCSTCHATRQPDPGNRFAADLNEFHGSLQIAHGKISCLSCHNSDDYDALRLADGTRVEFSEVMQLCAQCHGPQARDYEHNVHGGMNGHWDLSRGPRQKNNCVDCHYPHAPQFPSMQPTFKPRDRFLTEPSAFRADHQTL